MGLLSTIGSASARAYGFTRSAIAAAVDQYFNLTTLLLHGDGTNGAQNNTFLDSSSNNFSITRNGNTTQGTFSPFSQTGWSNYFGSGNYLVVADNAAFNLSGGVYTLEAWIYWDGNTSDYRAIVAKRQNPNPTAWEIFLNISTGALCFYDGTIRASSSTPTANAWNHVAAVWDGTNINLYLNGSRVLQTAATNTNQAASVTIGGKYVGAVDEFFTGYISNVRITKGGQLYTGTTYTVPTAPLTTTVSAGTVSLLTCQSNRFIDNSSNAFAITTTGSPSVQAFSPFAPTAAYSAATVGGSGYFDGNGDYLTIANNANLQISGNVDAFVEAYVYLNATGKQTFVSKSGISGSSYANYELGVTSATKATLIIGNSGSPGSAVIDLVGATTLSKGQWYHIVGTKRYVGGAAVNEYRLFLNGVLDAYSTSANGSDSRADNLTIGSGASFDPLSGYIGAVRLSNAAIPTTYQTTSTTVGASIFTAPTSALTVTSQGASSVRLLLNFTNGGIIDQTAKNVLETIGNAQISTSVKKFGTGSLAFNGSNANYLNLTDAQCIAFGTGDFTIEFWAYMANTGTFSPFIRPDASGDFIDCGYDWSTSQLKFDTRNAAVFAASVSLTANTWTHIAFSRTGTSFRAFVNGTQVGSTTTYTTNWLKPTGIVRIGASSFSSSHAINGYIDDLRITRFARYTSNFTAPTVAFADQ